VKTVAFVLGLSSAAAAQVTGVVTYEDKTYTNAGFTPPPYPFRPVRQAEVEIVRASDGAILGTGVTDNTGAFSVAGVPAAQTVFARVYARRAGNQIRATVRDNPASDAVYAAASVSILTTGAADPVPPLALSIAGGAAGVFNIFDVAVKSFQYQAGVDGDLPAVPPELKIYWEAGSSNGTYYTRTSNAVFLLGLSSDPDEFDDDIILHEIGHWVVFNFSIDDTLGGPHSVIDTLDPRTAWSEGWAHYWSSAVRRSLPAEYPSPSTQVDNFGSGNSVFDLEGPSFPSQAVMATNELAVAAILWDIIDPANEGGFDTLSGNEAELWRAVNDRIPTFLDITLEDFRAGLALEAPGIMAAVTGSEAAAGVMKARNVRYYADGAEPNDAFGSAAPLALGPAGLTQRTIFSAGDEDWFSLALGAPGGTLVVETRALGDGANTLLELYASNGTTLLAVNDDRAPGDPASRVQFAVAAAGTLYVRVVRSGTVVENGYYDVCAQVVFNLPPVLSPVSATATIGTAPLRVTLTGEATDPEGDSLEYQWDFDGDGRADWKSLRGGIVTATYARPGTFNATLRVVDSEAAVATRSVAITVIPTAAPTISVTQDRGSGTAPLTVVFGADLSGLVPASYEWDFESDGVIDRVSVTSPGVAFTYRQPGSFLARLTVFDAQGRAYRALSGTVTVSPGASPPSVSAFGATSGTIPYASTFTVSHADPGGAVSRVQFDFDGDGRVDLDVPPTTPGSTTVTSEVQRAGSFTARVRVTDDSGLSAESTAAYLAVGPGVRGWLVDPRAGDRLAGTSVTLTAEAVPSGRVKRVVFQYRTSAPPGPWIDVSGPLLSEGTLFSAPWDLSGVPALTSLDLRILIDDAVSSGDTANAVTVDAAAPTVRESGGAREKTAPPGRTTISRNAAGVWVILPAGVTTAATDRRLRLEPAPAPPANGSALGMVPVGGAWRVDVDATFVNAFRVRIPYAGPGEALGIHAFDASAGVWYRHGFSRVSPGDGWVEAPGIAPGVYAVFDASPLGRASAAPSDSDRCVASAPAAAGPAALLGIFLAAGGIGLWPRRR
jgi:PKD repeat protein